MTLNNGFRFRLKNAIRKSGMSYGDIAEETGICKSTIINYANEGRYPKVENLVILCDCLQVSADWLAGLTNDMTPYPKSSCGFILDRIEELMKARNVGKCEFCREIKVSRARLRNWLNGNNDMTFYSLMRIVEKYGVSVDWLLGLSEKMEGEVVSYETDRS